MSSSSHTLNCTTEVLKRHFVCSIIGKQLQRDTKNVFTLNLCVKNDDDERDGDDDDDRRQRVL